MTRSQPTTGTATDDTFITPKEAALFLRLSVSWLAKARIGGYGPPFMRFGRSVRYSKEALVRWSKLQQRVANTAF